MGLELNKAYLGDAFEMIPQIDEFNLGLFDLPYEETSNKRDKKLPMEDYINLETRGRVRLLNQQDFFLYCLKNKIADYEARWKELKQDGLWSLLNRKMPINGNMLFFAQGHFTGYLINSNKKQFKYDLAWDKSLVSNHLNARNMPMRQHENILVFNNSIQKATYNPIFRKGKPLHGRGQAYKTKELVNNNYGKFKPTDDERNGSTMKYPTTILRHPKPHPSVSKSQTEKPVPLLCDLITMYSNPNEIVLDCTCGSGGVGEASILTGRNYILIDIHAPSIEDTITRLSQVQTKIYIQ
jgi:site-specific DNA-methyltransferase (adenine-specific)